MRHRLDHVRHDLGRWLPTLGGALAYRKFCTPHLSRHRSPDHEILVERARFHLRQAVRTRVATSEGYVQAYVFAPEGKCHDVRTIPTVLFVHGWTAEAAFMTAFAEPFRKRGYRTILFDLPAHGESAGRQTNLIACAHSVRDVAEALGPIHFVVAHSLGGQAALLAGGGGTPMPYAYPFRDYVLVSMPHRFADVTRQFGAEEGLSPAAQRNYEQRLEQLAQRRIEDFTGVNLLAEAGGKALLLHARDDHEVPFGDAEEVMASSPSAELQAFEGLGHRKILYAPPVIRTALAYLKPAAEAITRTA